MPFKYSCFISYCSSESSFMKTFIEQFKKCLEDYLLLYLDEEVYIDESRLRPGCHYNEELASSICQSVCMIVVYTPKYKRHLYCLREYKAMECLEKKRIKLLGKEAKHMSNMGMIIPIILRGEIPSKIKNNVHYCDFSKFTTASPQIKEDPECVAKIENIARTIYEHYEVFNELGLDPCECESFSLPSEDDIKPWEDNLYRPTVPFPGRGAE